MGPPEMGMSSFLLASQPKRCTRDKEARNPEEGEEVHIYVPPELVSFMCGGTPPPELALYINTIRNKSLSQFRIVPESLY